MKKIINFVFHKDKESFGISRKKNANQRYYECPRCYNIITLDNVDVKDEEFDCPICGQKNLFPLEQIEVEIEGSYNYRRLSKFNTRVYLLGLCLIIVSIFFLFRPNLLNLKLGITFFILGVICPILLIEKNGLSVKVTAGSISLIIILFFTTGIDLELFFILTFLGLFFMKTVINDYVTLSLRLRMNIVLSPFFIIFVILIIRRIINIVSI